MWGWNLTGKSNMHSRPVTWRSSSLFTAFPFAFKGWQLIFICNSIMNFCAQDVRPGLDHKWQRTLSALSEGHSPGSPFLVHKLRKVFHSETHGLERCLWLFKWCRNDNINNSCCCCDGPMDFTSKCKETEKENYKCFNTRHKKAPNLDNQKSLKCTLHSWDADVPDSILPVIVATNLGVIAVSSLAVTARGPTTWFFAACVPWVST